MTEIEMLVCAAVVVSLLLEAFPRLAAATEHALVVTFVTLAAWPVYVAMALRPPVAPVRRAVGPRRPR